MHPPQKVVGGHCENSWFIMEWPKEILPGGALKLSINYLELYALAAGGETMDPQIHMSECDNLL